jgi:hypothetical protein
MIILIGLVILVAAVVVGVAGVLTNGGSAHTLTDQFAVFGYHVTGSTGLLFLYGIVVGAVGLFGLSLLLAGARRTARRGRTACSELKQSRRETAAANQDRGRPRPSAAGGDRTRRHGPPGRATELAGTTSQPGPTATPSRPAQTRKMPSNTDPASVNERNRHVSTGIAGGSSWNYRNRPQHGEPPERR